ncbi:hypothetical protein [Flavisphingomonas formosensis]|uniref:hypothetical protein n=1 Tax=Flavisphingomonas formosensis TaxID=861534 RepID=UPI0012F9DAF3|nr:hypothetical protein [Sphingomonas formosensis]
MTNHPPQHRCPACTALTVSIEAIHCTLPGCPLRDGGRGRRARLRLRLGEKDAA